MWGYEECRVYVCVDRQARGKSCLLRPSVGTLGLLLPRSPPPPLPLPHPIPHVLIPFVLYKHMHRRHAQVRTARRP